MPKTVKAAVLGLNSSVKYDVYFGADEQLSTNIIRNVRLVRTVEIDGVTFLVIESDSSKLQDDQGYIQLKEVLGFLPHKKMNPEKY
jgi:hypothetical protein